MGRSNKKKAPTSSPSPHRPPKRNNVITSVEMRQSTLTALISTPRNDSVTTAGTEPPVESPVAAPTEAQPLSTTPIDTPPPLSTQQPIDDSTHTGETSSDDELFPTLGNPPDAPPQVPATTPLRSEATNGASVPRPSSPSQDTPTLFTTNTSPICPFRHEPRPDSIHQAILDNQRRRSNLIDANMA